MTERAADTVTLELPARPDHIVLARLMAAAVGSRADFNVEDVDDLRLVVGEICGSLIGSDRHGRLSLTFNFNGGRIEVTCLRAAPADEEDKSDPTPSRFDPSSLSATIVQALVDDCRTVSENGSHGVWFVKQRDGASK